MGAKRERTHEITIKVTFDRPIYRSQAAYALWNALDGFDLYGNGDTKEPWEAPAYSPTAGEFLRCPAGALAGIQSNSARLRKGDYRMKKFVICLAAIALLAGCATDPSKIKAASTATGCSTVPGEDAATLARLESEQRQNVKNDITTTILLGVPLSKATGKDHAKEIARLKACLKIVS